MRAALLLTLVAALMLSARSFLPAEAIGGGTTLLGLGFLLLAAMQTGRIFHDLRLPHLTGYLLCGAIFGPEVLGLVTHSMVADLSLVKNVAVGLIALSAGCSLNLRELAPKLRRVGWFAGTTFVLAAILIWAALFLLLPWLPFSSSLTMAQRMVVALVGANVLVARSPAVVIAIIGETRATGAISELVLPLVVLSDLAVVITFSFTESLVGKAFPVAAGGGAASLAAHILLSLGVGGALGAVLALYAKHVGKKLALVVFGLLFVAAEAGAAIHLDPLLAGLAAGLFLENVSSVSGAQVARETEAATLPTYAVFFSVVGAEIHLHSFLAVAPWAIALAVVRGGGFYLGVRASARRFEMPRRDAHFIFAGLVPQAGVAVALALLTGVKYGVWGRGLADLLLGTIVVNELIGPILWRTALVSAGEAQQREDHDEPGTARRADTAAPDPDQSPARPVSR